MPASGLRQSSVHVAQADGLKGWVQALQGPHAEGVSAVLEEAVLDHFPPIALPQTVLVTNLAHFGRFGPPSGTLPGRVKSCFKP